MRMVRITEGRTESPTVRSLILEDKECVEAKPGQFLMIWIPGTDEIPFSILATDNQSVSIVVKRVGDATTALHNINQGQLLGVRGPFGNNFTIKDGRLLLIGGGTGVAPLVFLHNKLQRSAEVTFLTGAKTKDELLFREDLEKISKMEERKIVWTTEDGSYGIKGPVTTPLKRIMREASYDMVYTCGPEAMMRKVFNLTEKHGVPLEASLERLMRCAVGLCGSCIVGKYRVCKDGPVFGSQILTEVKDEFGVSKRDFDGRRISLD